MKRPAYKSAAYRAEVAAGMHSRNGRPHIFVQQVLKRHGTVTAWARIHCSRCCMGEAWHAYGGAGHRFVSLPIATASSWYSRRSKKSIPRRWAELIASEFVDETSGKSLVPATGRTWPNGIL